MNATPQIIIAIDGYSSCGKSTLAKELAGNLGYRYIDTGAMYRAVTLYLINHHIDIYHHDDVIAALRDIKIDFRLNPATGMQETYLNSENIENEIRVNPRVVSVVSEVSAISEVRSFLVKQQQLMGAEKGLVMDGRDIGTVVFPKAELKLFIVADPKVRAERRLLELRDKNQNTTFEEVLANLAKRDHTDTTRADSPLRKADDAIELDNSTMTREEQAAWVLEQVHKKLGTSY